MRQEEFLVFLRRARASFRRTRVFARQREGWGKGQSLQPTVRFGKLARAGGTSRRSSGPSSRGPCWHPTRRRFPIHGARLQALQETQAGEFNKKTAVEQKHRAWMHLTRSRILPKLRRRRWSSRTRGRARRTAELLRPAPTRAQAARAASRACRAASSASERSGVDAGTSEPPALRASRRLGRVSEVATSRDSPRCRWDPPPPVARPFFSRSVCRTPFGGLGGRDRACLQRGYPRARMRLDGFQPWIFPTLSAPLAKTPLNPPKQTAWCLRHCRLAGAPVRGKRLELPRSQDRFPYCTRNSPGAVPGSQPSRRKVWPLGRGASESLSLGAQASGRETRLSCRPASCGGLGARSPCQGRAQLPPMPEVPEPRYIRGTVWPASCER